MDVLPVPRIIAVDRLPVVLAEHLAAVPVDAGRVLAANSVVDLEQLFLFPNVVGVLLGADLDEATVNEAKRAINICAPQLAVVRHRGGTMGFIEQAVHLLASGSMTMDPVMRTLARGKNTAVVTTLTHDGTPASRVMWVEADDDFIYINAVLGQTKVRNLSADPRVTILIADANNPYHYGELRGSVVDTIVGSPAADHIQRLAQKYTGHPHKWPTDQRVMYRIRPNRQRIVALDM